MDVSEAVIKIRNWRGQYEMLIRWATEQERKEYGFDSKVFCEHDVLIAVDRRTSSCLGIMGFSRDDKSADAPLVVDNDREEIIREKLMRCADNQIRPRGGSFHYQYPLYAKRTLIENCGCNDDSTLPEEMDELADLRYSWVVTSPAAQGRLFGKCHVTCKYHNVLFYDMPKDTMANYMRDVQAAAKALHKITCAVKINIEIHGNSAPHLHSHLFPRYLDDDFPSAPIDYRMTEPSPYESDEEYRWFVKEMRKALNDT